MTRAKRTEIADLAETLRESLELSSPVDVRAAIDRLGGRLVETESLEAGMEALVRRSDDSFEIVLQQEKPPLRKRFSIAHELGHLFLHMGYLINPDLWGNAHEYKDSVYFRFGYGIEEEEANEFAAALLMPEKEFRKILAKFGYDIPAAADSLSQYFGVSKDAIYNRGRLLGLLLVR